MRYSFLILFAAFVALQAAPAPELVEDVEIQPRSSTINEALKCVLLVGPVACAKGKTDADKALQTARDNYPANTLHNGIGDAFRHCFWNALMTLSIGRTNAKKIADLHEDINTTGPLAEREMDLKNNEIGRQVGSESKDADEAQEKCAEHVRTGYLQLHP